MKAEKYINAGALLMKLGTMGFKPINPQARAYNAAIADAKRALTKMPAENVAPARYGEWLRHYCDEGYPDGYVCDKCGEWYVFDRLPNYCPECGAKMEIEEVWKP